VKEELANLMRTFEALGPIGSESNGSGSGLNNRITNLEFQD